MYGGSERGIAFPKLTVRMRMVATAGCRMLRPGWSVCTSSPPVVGGSREVSRTDPLAVILVFVMRHDRPSGRQERIPRRL